MKYRYMDNLSAAIVRDALRHYRRLLRRCKTWRRYKQDDSAEKKELEIFFRSRWCNLLTCGNGEEIMRRARKEILKNDNE